MIYDMMAANNFFEQKGRGYKISCNFELQSTFIKYIDLQNK
jgi:hypothetical protein